jgi:hypothetical protein
MHVCFLLQECKALLLSITLATLLPALTELLVRSTIPVGENLRSGRHTTKATLIKKKIKFSSYIGKFRVEQLQSHI